MEELNSYVEGVHRDGDYQCNECDFGAVKREELKSHVEAVHRDGAYQYDKCDFAAVKREELKSLVDADHRNGVYQFDECNFGTVINKCMLKQFVMVIPNVLTIVNKNINMVNQSYEVKKMKISKCQTHPS